MRNADIMVIGAGPGGSAVSYFLSKAGLKVILLDKARFPRDKTCGDGIPPRGLQVLNEMGVLKHINEAGYRLDVVKVTSPSGKHTELPIPQMPHGLSYALIVPRMKLDHMLLEHALGAGAVFHEGVHVSQVQSESDEVTAKSENGTTWRAKMVVIATGASSALLRNIHILSNTPQSAVAARAYFENIPNLEPKFHFVFSKAVLPGYGWVFPVSDSLANIGVGFTIASRRRKGASSPVPVFNQFVASPLMRDLLNGAQQVGPIKSFPLRMDFLTAPTYGERILLVGEAAGLVNPLTGDGIDYALETGKIAAEHIQRMFATGDFSKAQHEAYARHLHEEYSALFRYCERIQRIALRVSMLNILVPAANVFPKLAKLLTETVLGGKKVPKNFSIIRGIWEILTHLR